MTRTRVLRKMSRSLWTAASASVMFAFIGLVSAAEPDPKIIKYTMPKDIKWTESPAGSAQAIIAGDPAKPGLYVVLTKWHAGHMSRPHAHPNDRFITVISGTWWMGWGTKYDPDSTFPVPAGAVVTHFGGQPHYDGAKEGDVVLQIVGMGPATSVSKEVK